MDSTFRAPNRIEVDSRLRHLQLECKIIERSEHALGHGGFSEVFKGRCQTKGRGEKTVAIKILADISPRKLFVREIDIWKRLNHPYVVELLGASSTTGDPPWFCARIPDSETDQS